MVDVERWHSAITESLHSLLKQKQFFHCQKLLVKQVGRIAEKFGPPACCSCSGCSERRCGRYTGRITIAVSNAAAVTGDIVAMQQVMMMEWRTMLLRHYRMPHYTSHTPSL